MSKIIVSWFYELPFGRKTKPIVESKERFQALTRVSLPTLEVGEIFTYRTGRDIGNIIVKRVQ